MKHPNRAYFIIALCWACLLCAQRGYAQKDVDYKAAIVKKIIAELTYPSSMVKENIFTIGVVDNDGAIANAFANSLGSSTVKGNKIVIKRIKSASEIQLFPIIYYSESASTPLSSIARAISTKPMLLLTEKEGLIAVGSDINFIKIGGSWRYEINSSSIRNKRVNPSETFLQKALRDSGTISNINDTKPPEDIKRLPLIQDPKLLQRIKELEDDNEKLKQKVKDEKDKEAETLKRKENDLGKLKDELDQMTDIVQVRNRALEEAKKAKEEAQKAEAERISRIKIENEAEAKEREAKRQKEIDNQRLFIIAMLGVIGIISTIAILSIIASRRRKKIINQLEIARNELARNNEQLDSQNKEIIVQRNALDTQNKEILQQKNELTDKNQKITDSIRYAETIQIAMLPSNRELSSIFKSCFVIYEPKDIVSGDFYWASKREEGTFVAVADCTGHGVPGAFLSTVGNDILNELIKDKRMNEPQEILTNLHIGIYERLRQGETNNKDGMDICLCRIVEQEDGTVEVAFAGAKRPVYYSEAGEIKQLKGDSKYLGGMKEEPPTFTKQILILKKGEKLYLTTDGYADTPNAEKRKFGSGKFQELIQEICALDLPTQHQIFIDRWQEHKGTTELRDDTTIVAVEL